MKTEILQEGWVTFTRVHFKKGYVDRWSGDQADNPNNLEKRKLNLNSFIVYYRCNAGEWKRDLYKKQLKAETEQDYDVIELARFMSSQF